MDFYNGFSSILKDNAGALIAVILDYEKIISAFSIF